MPPTSKTVRVFISSTFRDMLVERDHLATAVFPELRERVEQLGLEFFNVDLRSGVPAKDIDGVGPFFLCILGQRYGWVLEPHHFRDTTIQQMRPKVLPHE